MELRPAFRVNGFLVLLVLVVVGGGALAGAIVAAGAASDGGGGAGAAAGAVAGFVVAGLAVVLLTGLTTVGPNEAKVLQFFGRYIGSVNDAGFFWVVPLTTKRRISLRVRNFETQTLKVNDSDGNPVQIAAVVVYRVVDSFKSAFAVDDYEEYVQTQSEAAVRHLATVHPYDSDDPDRTSLRNGAEVAEELTTELSERTALAGIDILEARITHLAYAPEIAQAMLVRQQAAQVVAARSRIVEGAVGMVGMALERLTAEGMVDLDEERRATMVSNLLVVLCGDRSAQPVVNTGSLYS
ncbi:regulator of protease activity HflC (stomatin/prohibitin superfamily) [Nocardia transvalensis]|uniref:Regulator of protease activity HflC (Stomatin/prohibitin superfamily) n=1 Tax=Nocardia transvalensis TaxID=37333 RepID=A0A7W9PLD4_9NOCA|nr:SPFH domain-containing protein [Nocardia transvalensis]MBB5917788.1 regulator of protease activity HflC (stomatin/prohibitin superfamily) [Nocardia transvalensis]